MLPLPCLPQEENSTGSEQETQGELNTAIAFFFCHV